MLASSHLIVLTEEGELALVRADPGAPQEITRFPAIEGKTWNHPAMSDGILLIRNIEEMASVAQAWGTFLLVSTPGAREAAPDEYERLGQPADQPERSGPGKSHSGHGKHWGWGPRTTAWAGGPLPGSAAHVVFQ
jgi:hypothetical protein